MGVLLEDAPEPMRFETAGQISDVVEELRLQLAEAEAERDYVTARVSELEPTVAYQEQELARLKHEKRSGAFGGKGNGYAEGAGAASPTAQRTRGRMGSISQVVAPPQMSPAAAVAEAAMAILKDDPQNAAARDALARAQSMENTEQQQQRRRSISFDRFRKKDSDGLPSPAPRFSMKRRSSIAEGHATVTFGAGPAGLAKTDLKNQVHKDPCCAFLK